MKMKGARVSPWSTPAVISKNSVSPSGVITVASVLIYNDFITSTIGSGIPKWVEVGQFCLGCILLQHWHTLR